MTRFEIQDKYESLKQSHKEVVERCNDLESKLKSADEVIERVESYISDVVYDRDKYDKMDVSLRYYKSLK